MESTWNRLRKTLFGDRAFYKSVLVIILPVIIQNGISNFVSMLDNLMVGALGDNEMSGVAVANQLIFIFNLTIFGGLSGPGIFTSQFFGAKDNEGIRNSIRLKLIISVCVFGVALLVLALWQDGLIGLFLKGEADATAQASPELILQSAKQYLNILLIGLLPMALSYTYASTMRECGDAFWPMVASVSAVVVNMVGNWLLIFGNLGCPKLGVQGAAIATVISRFVELGIVMLRCHLKPIHYPYMPGVYRHFRIPGKMAFRILKIGAPLLANELLWSICMTLLSIIYSLCGIIVVGAVSINSTVNNLFNVVAYSTGTAVAVIIGHDLGAGDFYMARKHRWWLLSFAEILAVFTAAVLCICAGPITSLYSGVSDEVRALAIKLICLTALATPIGICCNVSYFAIRSGGRTDLTFIFDCGFCLVVSVPLAFLLVKVFHLDIVTTYAIVMAANLLKATVGFVMLKKEVWIKNITHIGG